MFKQFWKTWTIDKPAALGDWMWEVFVVQLAALLNRLTLRRIIAIIPLVILIIAYAHRIPLPPELMLVGDLLAYIDIFSVIVLLSLLSRVSTIWFFTKHAAEHVSKLVASVLTAAQRLDVRHRREGDTRGRRRLIGRDKVDDEHPALGGFAWA